MKTLKSPQGGHSCSPAILSASKRFGRYGTESEKRSRAADIARDETIERLLAEWNSIVMDEGFDRSCSEAQLDSCYNRICASVLDIDLSDEGMSKFLLALRAFEEEAEFPSKAGLFLSALANRNAGTPYSLDLRDLPLLRYLGFRNRNSLLLAIADTCSDLAREAKCGKVVFYGSSFSAGCFMTGGELEIFGSNGSFLGAGNMGGKISIYGRAGELIGDMMKSGEIHVIYDKLPACQLGDVEGGHIFLNGKPVFCGRGLS
jgi:hypothetical protein